MGRSGAATLCVRTRAGQQTTAPEAGAPKIRNGRDSILLLYRGQDSPRKPGTVTEPLDPGQNLILSGLEPEVRERVFPYLEKTSMPLGRVLYESGDKMGYVYFPVDCIVSLLYVMESGASAEISVVGNEGVVGISLFMGGESTSSRAVVQAGGSAYRLAGGQLVQEFHRHGQLMSMLLRYTQALITQMAQTAVCNRHHAIDQQLCRWLLLSLDRLRTPHLIMTQELIANMLGVRREGVTEAAGRLQELDVINYHRGHIEVIDRAKLEELSCECYAVVKKEQDRLLEPTAPHTLYST